MSNKLYFSYEETRRGTVQVVAKVDLSNPFLRSLAAEQDSVSNILDADSISKTDWKEILKQKDVEILDQVPTDDYESELIEETLGQDYKVLIGGDK
ncbi:MAG TPA: hypothetical protein DEO59_16850 [Balneola sp.]|nr:hypothetical protein [Balneola sp.]